MSEPEIYPVLATIAQDAHADFARYQAMYRESVENPEEFWKEQSKTLDWISPPNRVKDTTYEYPNVAIKWFEDGVINVCANCVDRHLASRGDQVALIWERDEPGNSQAITYREIARTRLQDG